MEKDEVIRRLEKAIKDLKEKNFGKEIYEYNIKIKSNGECYTYVGWSE